MSPNSSLSRRTTLATLAAVGASLAGCNSSVGTDAERTESDPTDDHPPSSATRPRTPTATPTPTPDPRLAWSRSFEFEVGPPHVADGVVVSVTWDETPVLYVVDTTTGDERWRRSFATSPREIRWAGGDLYVGTGTTDRNDPGGRLHRYAPDGREMWTTVRTERLPETDGPRSYSALAPVGADDERIYAVTKRYDDDRGEDLEGLYAFDVADGSLVWSRSAPSGIGRAYRSEDAVVFVGGVGPALQSVAAADGRLRWQRRGTVHDVDAEARLALQDTEGEPGPLHVVDLRTGESRLSVRPPADWAEGWYGIRGVLVPDAGRLVWCAVWRGSTYIAATSLDDGTDLWARQGTLNPFWTTVVDGMAVLAEEPPEDDADWALRTIDAVTGDVRWRRPFAGAYRIGYAGAVDGILAVEVRLGDGDTHPDPDDDEGAGSDDGETEVSGDGSGNDEARAIGAGGDGTPDRVAVVDAADGTIQWGRRLADWTESWAVLLGDRLYAGETAVNEDRDPVAGRLRAFGIDGGD